MKRRIAASVAIALLASPLGAGAMDLGMYNQYKDNPNTDLVTDLYLHGMGHGFLWANVQLERSGRAKIFCMPDHLPMSVGLVESILDSEISRQSRVVPYGADMANEPIELYALWGFMRTFPCN